MKSRHREKLRRQAKEYHRTNGLAADEGGIQSRHVFEPDCLLSWWHDLGFVFNKRGMMIWWTHPRLRYADAISDAAWNEAGTPPKSASPLFASEPQWKRVGRSRKKIISYLARETPAELRRYYDHLQNIETRLRATGIVHQVSPALRVTQLKWGTGIDLCVPMELRTKEDAEAIVALSKKLLKRGTTLALEFPEYQYGQIEWLNEAQARAEDDVRRRARCKASAT